MVTILKGKASLQIKFGLSYILIIVVVLVILNTYPLLASENLVFRTKETSVSASVKMVESALSGLDRLTEESVRQALDGLEETGVSRILVTDTAGRVLYDTRETESAVGSYAFYTEIEQALEGDDAFSSRYDGAAFLSRGASPVVYRNETIGAVCAYEYDTVQAGMLRKRRPCRICDAVHNAVHNKFCRIRCVFRFRKEFLRLILNAGERKIQSVQLHTIALLAGRFATQRIYCLACRKWQSQKLTGTINQLPSRNITCAAKLIGSYILSVWADKQQFRRAAGQMPCKVRCSHQFQSSC